MIENNYKIFYQINWGFVQAIRYDAAFVSSNIQRVAMNPFLNSHINVRFWWGGHMQWASDQLAHGNPYDHEFRGDRHPNLNQTGEMWKWMYEEVNKGNAESDWFAKFKRVTAFDFNETDKDATIDTALTNYRYRDFKRSKPLFVEFVKGYDRSMEYNNVTRWNKFLNASDFVAACNAPFILQLQISGYNKCARLAAETFRANHKRNNHNALIYVIVAIIAIILLYFLLIRPLQK